MNFICYLQMCIIRLFRDPLGMILTIATPSFFTFFFWIIYHNNAADITLAIINDDPGIVTSQESVSYSKQLISIIKNISTVNQSRKISLIEVKTNHDADIMIRKGTADGIICIPSDFSSKCLQSTGASWHFTLQDGDSYSKSLAVFLYLCNAQFNNLLNKQNQTVTVEMTNVNQSKTFSAFNSFIPGLLSFAVIMLIFSVSGVISREIESGAFTRLRMSRLTSIELILAQSIVHFCLGISGILLTLLTIRLTGFTFNGNIIIVLVLCSLSIISTIAIGIAIASVTRSRHKTLLVSSIFMFLFILFSGIIFPLPRTEILTFGQWSISLFDFLPTVHLSSGLIAILLRKATISDISYHIYSLVILSTLLSFAGWYCMKYFVYIEQRKVK